MKFWSMKKATIAAVTLAGASLLTISWSETGLSVSTDQAQARARLYVTPYHRGPYIADDTGLPWYAVRAYYHGGPWTYGYADWKAYAARAGITCVPGTAVKGGDGIMYVCQ